MENKLKSIDSEISKSILNSVGTDIKPDVTLLNIDKDDYLTFTTMKNFVRNLEATYDADFSSISNGYNSNLTSYLRSTENNIINASRSQIKIGRLVNQMFPGKFKSAEVEEFVNKFKSVMESSSSFEIVSGDEIEKCYDKKNYLEIRGTLGSSCMGSKKGIFDLYTKNNNCRLLILKEDDKIIGRALVWKLSWLSTADFDDIVNDNDVYFMDRQYTINDSDVNRFREYAKSQKWAYKEKNTHSNFGSVVVNGVVYTHSNMEVESNLTGLKSFPYLDTFRTYDPKTGKLFNLSAVDVDDKENYINMYDLSDTDGGYDIIEDGVWSEWHDRMLDSEDAVWSDWADSYINRYDGEYVEGSWYPSSAECLCWSEIDDSYHLEGRCEWSDTQQTYIPISRSAIMITNIDISYVSISTDIVSDNYNGLTDIKYLYSNTLEKLVEFYRDEYKYISSDVLYSTDIPNVDFKYIYEDFLIEVYRVKHDEVYEDLDIYLTEEIAKEFNIKLDKESGVYREDIFHFIDSIISLKDRINLFRDKPIITIEDIIESPSAPSDVVEIYDTFYK